MSRFAPVVMSAAVAVLAFTPLAAQKAAPSHVMLEAARQKETLQGDLAGAIKQYRAIADQFGKTDRAVAAQALVAMAECYRKLGDAQARTVYERIVREFGDQKDAVALARARLVTTDATVARSGIVNRQLWISRDPNVDIWEGGMSPDGRYVTYVNWESGDLKLLDLQTGIDRSLTHKTSGDSHDFAEFSAISRDGKQVAFSWSNLWKDHHELRVLSLDAGASPPPRTIATSADGEIAPIAWSPDGKRLAVETWRQDGTIQLGLLRLVDGAITILKTTDRPGPENIVFSPDGAFLAYDFPVTDVTTRRDVFVLRIDGNREVHAVSHPAEDLAVGWSSDGRTLLFASDRAGGMGLWALPVADGKPQGSPSLIKPDVDIGSTLGLTSAGNLLYRAQTGGPEVRVASVDLATGKTISPPVPLTEIYPLPSAGDWSPDGKAVVLRSHLRGSATLSIVTLANGQTRSLNASFPYIAQVQWLTADSIVIRSRDSRGRWGLYRVDVSTGAVTPIEVGECPTPQCARGPNQVALIHSVSPDFKSVFYRVDDRSQDIASFVQRDLSTGRERELLRGKGLLGFRLSPDGRQLTFIEPDSATKSQTLNLLSIESGRKREVYRVAPPLTMTNLLDWAPDGQHLIFGQAGKEETVWIISLDGGSPVKLDLKLRDASPSFSATKLHPDLHRILVTAGSPVSSEVWTLEHFLPAPAAKK